MEVEEEEAEERRRKVEEKEGKVEEEVVPFFYYVTPKRFRSTGREKEKEKEKDVKDTGKDTKDTGAEEGAKTGLGRLRGWLHRGESSDSEMQKPEGVTEGEMKESSLKRLFRRPQSPTPTPDQPKDAKGPAGDPQGAGQVPQAPRPARLWFTRRSQSERRASPISPTPPPIRAATPQEERRKGLTLPLNLRQPSAPSPSPAGSPIPSPVPIEEGRLKKFLRQQSEVVLRPFTRRQDPAKRRSAPPCPAPATPPQEVSEIEARHPSINTYIDDTPTTPTNPHSILPTPDLSPSSPVGPPPPSAPSSLPGTLTRRLTFSIPFASGRGGGGAGSEEEMKPVERAIEARSNATDYVGSMVRCLHLTKCFVANSKWFEVFRGCFGGVEVCVGVFGVC
ncbi:hypothetical protein E2C01_071022 [Portunus trituberculatus]|uniref:Uncharacterized protein n=1 Tax=Portunus trituberculatus TaxID=210409 RepID=A0A5B7I377_PORTR|nr:hypothetical protein [Portunus trituberculatus]